MDRLEAAPTPGPTVVPVLDGLDEEFDDLLGEILAPPKPEPIDDLDDLLGEISEPPKVAPVDDLDDLLGEITEPAKAAPADALEDMLGDIEEPAKAEAPDDFDDILGEIAGPAKAEPVDDLDDILGEIAGPAKTEPADDFNDILGEIAGPAKAQPVDDFDDILSDIAGPAKAEASLDDILGEVAPTVSPAAEPTKAKSSPKRAAPPKDETDDLSAMLDEMASQAPPPVAAPVEEAIAEAPKKPGIGAKLGKLGGLVPSLKGTRQISRKAHVGLVGTAVLLGLTTIVQTTYILTASHKTPAGGHAAAGHEGQAPAVPLVPVDYSKMDLTRYRDKVRALGEGGRDMLRNPAIKDAILQLDNGEQLYDELVKLSRLSKAADLVVIGENRLTINSCNFATCSDKSFKLVYDLQHENATVCMTEKYLNGSYLSYNYSPEGYSEVPTCNAGAPPAPVVEAVPEEGAEHEAEAVDQPAEGAEHEAEGGEESAHGADH
ncbi:hypothetical protein KRR38_04670 [Novosphingobium sp. G106]|uniref:hypothetical protein n=1 Tax=Novosphingobium sp. G106 TaxID=2849500 RepID=UPI001C2D8D65|nr:hypothetical protein [Novosphingobium sp. G106]MBV1686985.1 hypothetical protein [Novosphingobium sp. G106]